ncbi:MAG: Co2+/Mg2+ efflux protein ApaG [Deltaproteobacteria bacterium]|nr:Co2+/Mg2+ efflux protein ApaG [Deltaproteobacteria bacterium]
MEVSETQSTAVTRGIKVEVQSRFAPERTEPAKGAYCFVYQVRLTNESSETVQLMSRYWVITDANGRIEEVQGAGVVGEQPVLEPGESYDYSSFCPLDTTEGVMQGAYQMVTADGEQFDVVIAPFALNRDEALH